MYGGSPGFDICNYMACSFTPEQMKDRVTQGMKIYHDTLVANGVSNYSWEEFNKDFDNAIWHALSLATFGGKMVSDVRAGAMSHPEGSEERAEGLRMVDNMVALFKMVSDRAHFLAEWRQAYTPTHFSVKGYTA